MDALDMMLFSKDPQKIRKKSVCRDKANHSRPCPADRVRQITSGKRMRGTGVPERGLMPPRG